MSKGSIFLQYLCNLFYFYLLGRINNKQIPGDSITPETYGSIQHLNILLPIAYIDLNVLPIEHSCLVSHFQSTYSCIYERYL